MINGKAIRYPELDLLRTLAVVMMIIYHAAYDLEVFYGWSLGLFDQMGWYVLRQGTASLFLLLVGCSFAISWNRTPVYSKYFKRGLGVIGCGMIVSTVTYLVEPETYVRFGILHLIGVSILLLPFFTFLREGNAVIGMMITGLGMILPATVAGAAAALLPLGFMPPGFTTVDYFPLIPWFGVVLIGIAIGNALYVRHHPQWNLRVPLWMTVPGRHALWIYLLHQPVLLAVLGGLRITGIL